MSKWLACVCAILMLCVACESQVETVDANVEALKDELAIHSREIQEITKLKTDIDTLTRDYELLVKEVEKLSKQISYNNDEEDLIVLNTHEYMIYSDYIKSHDDALLEGLNPLSVCKMYLYSSYLRDYDTVYALYTTRDDYIQWSKVEDEQIIDDHRISDFSIFTDVYELRESISEDGNHASIGWKSLNGYVDDLAGPFIYSFSLIKESGRWKVSFIPMQ